MTNIVDFCRCFLGMVEVACITVRLSASVANLKETNSVNLAFHISKGGIKTCKSVNFNEVIALLSCSNIIFKLLNSYLTHHSATATKPPPCLTALRYLTNKAPPSSSKTAMCPNLGHLMFLSNLRSSVKPQRLEDARLWHFH